MCADTGIRAIELHHVTPATEVAGDCLLRCSEGDDTGPATGPLRSGVMPTLSVTDPVSVSVLGRVTELSA